MIFRQALVNYIKQMQTVRNAVKENTLSDPSLISDDQYKEFITTSGKGWVCEVENTIVGFAIADLKEHNIWALFIEPAFEKKRIAQTLQKLMLDWYFYNTKITVWLGTDYNTRAEHFYRKCGWTEAGTNGDKEIKFEMTYENWVILSNNYKQVNN